MNPTHLTSRRRISTSAVSIALLFFSGLWLLAVCEYWASSGVNADWSATPLFWMLAVVLTPAICFVAGIILFDQRRHQSLGLMEWWALLAAVLPVTLGTLVSVWAVRALFLMAGV